MGHFGTCPKRGHSKRAIRQIGPILTHFGSYLTPWGPKGSNRGQNDPFCRIALLGLAPWGTCPKVVILGHLGHVPGGVILRELFDNMTHLDPYLTHLSSPGCTRPVYRGFIGEYTGVPAPGIRACCTGGSAGVRRGWCALGAHTCGTTHALACCTPAAQPLLYKGIYPLLDWGYSPCPSPC